MGLEGVQNYIIGVILFMLVITGGVFMIGSFYNKDPSIDSIGQIDSFNKSLNKASEVTASVSELDSSIQSVSNENVGVLGWLNALVGSIFNGLRAIGDSLGFMSTASSEASAIFGIPAFILPLILLIVTVIIIFAIYSAITKV